LEFKIDFSEPIPKMIQRLKNEHRDFRLELNQIEETSQANSQEAVEMLNKIRKPIVRHAVEEEARVLRVIMEKAKDQSEQSIKIIQEHRGIIEFLDKRISQIDSSQAAGEVKAFVDNLRKHFSEEDEIVFPLALKADSM
jgi:hemerythrin-like domain-containing protein